MAKFIGSGKQKGLLGNIEIELKRSKTKAPKIMTRELKKPLENILPKDIMGYFDESVDKSKLITEDANFENRSN